MQIVVHEDRSISWIREEFNLLFPYLMLEFQEKLQKTGGSSKRKIVRDTDKKLGDYLNIQPNQGITITPEMTVERLEQLFRSIYGLEFCVLRKSGKMWLRTTITSSWTLKQQNDEGEILSRES
jgi:hypothetical protein